ncbi:hypothetical protein P6709_06605 [Jeotgalibacillus sp. ET6]|uniref:hypothetical protein n=1 Tax=Jeotgalibacillus sp. ET6 TaxID=3037260 RepID=UPI002418A39D|nr:hypothetical protein [Jeotgalibacillus sp. ET6]MDG5471411.1 hypothetical protein [Jeotgalibacillus sp. ET6]
MDILIKLNSNTNILNENEFIEQQNLDDFKKLTKDLDQVLINFGSLDAYDGNEIEKMLFEIHRIITTLEWHFSEINTLNISILKDYKNKISMK